MCDKARPIIVKNPGETSQTLHASQSQSLEYDWLEHDFAKDPRPLIEALRSGAASPEYSRSATALPEHLRHVLIDLLERYRLVLKPGSKRIPSYRRVSNVEATLEVAAAEYRLTTGGPITSEEMDRAVKVLETRAKLEGRGHRRFSRRAVAQQLRSERFALFAAEFELKPKTLMNYLKGKRGSSRRRPR